MIKLTNLHTFSDPFVSAASGLVLSNDQFYMVADDELFAVVVDKNHPEQGKTITLFSGALAEEKKLRKQTKPDLESMVVLPSGDLLCIPSGSEKHRSTGVLIKAEGYEVKLVDFSRLYSELRKTFSELNIEGAVIVDEWLRLFQRGNGKKQQNGTVNVHLKDLLQDKITISFVKHYELGKQNGANLSFTDATITKDKIYFLAVAEDCESTYLDGEFKGSVLGTMDLKGNLLRLEALDLKYKPEGLCTDGENFYVVTDADDRSTPAKLFQGKLPKT
jgi:hypothetical protein